MISYPNLLCLLEDVKTDMKPVDFQEDQIQILTKMKIMKGRDEKEVRELFGVFYGEREEKGGRGEDSQSCSGFMDSVVPFSQLRENTLLFLSL